MQTRRFVAVTLISIVGLAVVACAPTSGPSSVPSPIGTPMEPGMSTPEPGGLPQTGSKAPVTIQTSQTDALGEFLTDGEGRTVYLFTKDAPNTSTCTDKCAEKWPPLTTDGEPLAGSGVDAALLGTLMRDDGTTQVTYNQLPLYYYAEDINPGDTSGQGVGDAWYVISPAGEKIEK